MSFSEGDFVKIDYSARRASDNTLVYTTKEDIAKKEGTYSKDDKYGTQLVIVGKNSTIKGVDAAVKGMAVGEEKKVTIEPKDAFGERDERLVNVMHLSDFRNRDIDPKPGLRINIDGNIATVKSVNSGRVMVDANHPLAGETLLYEIKVVSKIDSSKEKVSALAEFYSLAPKSVEVEGGNAKIFFGDEVGKDSDYFVNKANFVDAVWRYLDVLTTVTVMEEYAKKKNG